MRRARRERLALALLLLVLAAALTWDRLRSRQDIDSAEREQLTHQVAGLESIFTMQFASARSAMHGVRAALPGWPAGDRQLQANEQFRTLATALTGIGRLQRLDDHGRVVASNRGDLIGLDLSDRSYFQHARVSCDPATLYVSAPFRTASEEFSIDLAVATTGPGGEFTGVIVATLEPGYFSTVLASSLYAADMRAAIVHGDGVALLFSPPSLRRQGTNLAVPESLFSRFRDSGQPALVLDGRTPGSDEPRVAAFRWLQPAGLSMDRPLALAVSRSSGVVFETWRKNTAACAAVLASSSVLAWGSLLAFQRRRAHQQLRDSRALSRQQADAERLELALRGADLALWDDHIPSGRVAVSARWYSMLGQAPGEVSPDTRTWEALIHPDDRARAVQSRDDHIAGRTPSFDVTYRMRHASGDWIWIVNRGRVVERDASGRAIRMVGTNFDATQWIEAEEALRRSEQSLAITLESMGDGVIATDTAGGVTRLNAAAEALTGWSAAAALGQPLARIFRIVDAVTREPADDRVARVLGASAAESVSRVAFGDAALLVARDGSERRITDSAAPIRDAAGRVVGVVLVVSDVSRQHAAAEALRASERQLATLTAALPGPVARFDRAGRHLFTNATCERWFGEPASACLGRAWHEVFPPAFVALLDTPMRSALAGLSTTFDATLPTLAGDRHAMVSVVPDRDTDGAVHGCIVALTDVTDRKLAEEALRQSEERSRTLLGALRAGVVVHAADGTIVDANPAACRILGRSYDTFVGARCDDAGWGLVEDDETAMPQARAPSAQVRAGVDIVNDQLIGVRRPGHGDDRVWLLCNAFGVRTAAGALAQIVVTFVDVSERRLAQAQLRESEERLRMASRIARLGGWRVEVASRQLTLSPEGAALIGAEAARRAGAEAANPLPLDGGFASALAPPERARWQARVERAMADGLPIDDDFIGVGAHGGPAHWHVLGEAVRDPAGGIVALQGAVQDVTEQREAQEQLRLLVAAVAGLNDAVLITDAEPVDEPGPRTVFVNAAFERITGWTLAEVTGRSPRMMQGPLTAGPELDRLRAAVKTRQQAHVELVNYRRDGSPYWVEISMVPLTDAHGRVTHFVAVQREITERKQAAAEIDAGQRELAATLAAVPDLLFDLDLDGRVHQCHAPPNGRPVADPAQYVGRRIADVFPPDAVAVVMAALGEAHAHGHSAGRQYELASRVGTQSFELSVSRKQAADDGPPRFIVLARDVSERRHLEAERRLLERQLREMQKMESIGTLAGGIAHDFNNILAAILGNLALASDEIAVDHPARSTLAQIGKAGVRARSLVQQILTFSRRQRSPLRPRALRPIVEETLGLLRATLPASVRLDSRIAPEELVVSADATQLQQVLMNLCTNAWQALPEGRGRIEIGLETLETGVRIADFDADRPSAHLWVADDGAGMDALTRERIFDPFFTTKPVGQGTGLGLSVVHGIVRSHSGAVAVESALGEGTVFHLYLPLVADATGRDGDTGYAALGAPLPIAAAGEPDASTGTHLLYVDDDEVMVLMVQRLLQRDGYRVTGCGSAADALAVLASPTAGHVDLVVSDFNMPEMSGIELAERIGVLRPGLPTIITSGYLSDELRRQAEAIGVRAMLQKERTLEELGDLVREVLAEANAP